VSYWLNKGYLERLFLCVSNERVNWRWKICLQCGSPIKTVPSSENKGDFPLFGAEIHSSLFVDIRTEDSIASEFQIHIRANHHLGLRHSVWDGELQLQFSQFWSFEFGLSHATSTQTIWIAYGCFGTVQPP
jgi:hypothetical protein